MKNHFLYEKNQLYRNALKKFLSVLQLLKKMLEIS
jgi:hypothetical protein